MTRLLGMKFEATLHVMAAKPKASPTSAHHGERGQAVQVRHAVAPCAGHPQDLADGPATLHVHPLLQQQCCTQDHALVSAA